MTKKLQKEIKKWIADYERLTGECYGDDDTLEGSAYNLLQRSLGKLESNQSNPSAL